jgi:hypothetical protein
MRTQRVTAKLLAVGAMAVIGLGMSANPTDAQDKKPVTPDLVRNIDEPGFNPYQHSSEVFSEDCCSIESFPIPVNKVVVVEHVSVTVAGPSAGLVAASVQCSTTADASGFVEHFLVMVQQGTVLGTTFYTASQPVKCYAASPGSLAVSIARNGFTPGTAHWFMSISGYTVPR